MFDNIFLDPCYEGPRPETPKRLYMRIDQVEEEWLFFDAVGADFFDRLPEIAGIAGWSEFSSKAPVFILQMHNVPPLPWPWWWDDSEKEWGPLWLEADLLASGESVLYFSLFREGLPVSVSFLGAVNPTKQSQLEQAFDLSAALSTETKIQSKLDAVTDTIEWVGVYDVGQGNSNGLCDAHETPLVYFDLGGGIAAHLGTFPTAMSDFCYAKSPLVVLSHWDWDHWSSGARFYRAKALDWIVPFQGLGAAHGTFASGLHKAGKLHVWPPGVPYVQSNQIKIVKCTGKGISRNHSGLALEVTGPAGEPPILLTGDARYTAIPGATNATYTSLVAPHHGADMKSHATPAGTHLAGDRVAYSFGLGNSFKHPRPVTFHDHHLSQWPHQAHGGNPPVDRDTTGRGAAGLGHLGLGWTANPTLPGHICGSPGCSVELQHT